MMVILNALYIMRILLIKYLYKSAGECTFTKSAGEYMISDRNNVKEHAIFRYPYYIYIAK